MRIDMGDGKILEIAQGDITTEATDAIVNAANSSLMGGGGVDGAIHRAGGPEILRECQAIVARQGTLATGQVVATTGGKLSARHVLHTVGPIYNDGQSGEPEELASCYRESIRLADAMQLTSMAFPSISTGIYGYPTSQAAPIALQTVADTLRLTQTLTHVRFLLYDRATLSDFERAARRLSSGGTGVQA